MICQLPRLAKLDNKSWKQHCRASSIASPKHTRLHCLFRLDGLSWHQHIGGFEQLANPKLELSQQRMHRLLTVLDVFSMFTSPKIWVLENGTYTNTWPLSFVIRKSDAFDSPGNFLLEPQQLKRLLPSNLGGLRHRCHLCALRAHGMGVPCKVQRGNV